MVGCGSKNKHQKDIMSWIEIELHAHQHVKRAGRNSQDNWGDLYDEFNNSENPYFDDERDICTSYEKHEESGYSLGMNPLIVSH